MQDLYTKVRVESGYYDEQLRIIRIKEVKSSIRILQAKKRKGGMYWDSDQERYLQQYKDELKELQAIPRKFNF